MVVFYLKKISKLSFSPKFSKKSHRQMIFNSGCVHFWESREALHNWGEALKATGADKFIYAHLVSSSCEQS